MRPTLEDVEDEDTDDVDDDDLPVVVGYAIDTLSGRMRLITRSPLGGPWLRDPDDWVPVESDDPA